MRTSELIQYYSQPGFIKFMLAFSKGREVAPRFGNYFGERPQSFRFEGELLDVIRQGATSFHCSEEHWVNVMALSPDMDKKSLDLLRSGWDLILDVDCPVIEYSRVCAKLIIDALDFHDIKDVSVKFSGGTGFHVGVAFNNPDKLKGEPVSKLFPEALRKIGLYIKEMIGELLSGMLMGMSDIYTIAGKLNAKPEDLMINGQFNPFSVVDIDPVAISTRHLIRAPYSLNEKKWLVSKPIKPSEVLTFDPESARPEKIDFSMGFLDKPCDASKLFRAAFDWHDKTEAARKTTTIINQSLPKTAVSVNCFPPCINKILGGLADGKKRALFILINFYHKCGYDWPFIEERLLKWNESNNPHLRSGYIKAQLDWAQKQGGLMPNNCDNPNYKDLGVCQPDNLCAKVKNPVTYALHKNKMTQPKRRASPIKKTKRKDLKQ